MKLWGEYPAMMDECAEQTVRGVAYKVKLQEEAHRPAAYETDMYRTMTFVFDAGILLLREEYLT